jgi:hypothetical protein
MQLLGIDSLAGTASIIFLVVVASFAALVLIRGVVGLVVYRTRSRIRGY